MREEVIRMQARSHGLAYSIPYNKALGATRYLYTVNAFKKGFFTRPYFLMVKNGIAPKEAYKRCLGTSDIELEAYSEAHTIEVIRTPEGKIIPEVDEKAMKKGAGYGVLGVLLVVLLVLWYFLIGNIRRG